MLESNFGCACFQREDHFFRDVFLVVLNCFEVFDGFLMLCLSALSLLRSSLYVSLLFCFFVLLRFSASVLFFFSALYFCSASWLFAMFSFFDVLLLCFVSAVLPLCFFFF